MGSSEAFFVLSAFFTLSFQVNLTLAKRMTQETLKIESAGDAHPTWAPVSGATWDKDGVPLEDSNVANMNSDEAKAKRHEAATKEPAWEGVGTESGLWIWRIENFKAVPWDKTKYGQFHMGDSYIVLHVVEKESALSRNIYFWLGETTTIDEMGTAAYKTVELDDYFNGEPTQNREVQQHESEAFRILFPKLKYLEGGVHTGFKAVPQVSYRKTLSVVRKLGSGEKCPATGDQNGKYCILEMPLSASSLNKGDCFLLEIESLHVWCGDESSGFEKSKSRSIAQDIQDKRPGVTSFTVETEAENFVKLLGDGSVADIQESIDKLADVGRAVGEGVLYEISDDKPHAKVFYEGQMRLTLEEISRGDLKKSMLNPKEVMMVDTRSEIFLWIGSKASEIERRNAMRMAMMYLKGNGNPNAAIHVFKDGVPISNPTWNSIFDN